MKQQVEKKYRFISAILMVAVVAMPFSAFPKRAVAQSLSYGYGATNIGAAISQLPMCREAVSDGMSWLFGGIGSLFSSGSGSSYTETAANQQSDIAFQDSGSGISMMDKLLYTDSTESLETTLEDLTEEYSAETSGKKVFDKTAAEKLRQIARDISAMRQTIEDQRSKESCLDGIGKVLAKMALQKITLSTVDWINHGFEGKPAWIDNKSTFWSDIAKSEVLEFGAEIDGISPYSKNWLRNQAVAFNHKFADNARYSLNELIRQTTPQYSAETFREDFGKGGWSAWSYMTQVPANNPLGFQILASNELSRRLSGTQLSRAQEIRESLQEAGGFLGDERCVDPVTGKPNGVTRAEHLQVLKEKNQILCPSDQWEYVTPGKMIADAATSIVKYPNDALLNVDDLNDAVAAVSDAIISHFASKWMSEGLAGLGDQYTGGYSNSNGVSFETQVDKDFAPIHKNTSSWLQQNPNFNIRTDLTQALVDEQRTYVDKLKQQNKEMNSTIDGSAYRLGADGVSNAYGLLPAIYQLDYCIPGPHPGWVNDARKKISVITQSVLPPDEINNMAGEILNGAVTTGIGIGVNELSKMGDFIGDAVPFVGPVLSGLIGAITGDDEAKRISTNARCHYTAEFYHMTGMSAQCRYGMATDQVDINMSSKEGLFQVVNGVLERYMRIMNQTYFSSDALVPRAAEENEKYYKLLPGYLKLMEENENTIKSLSAKINTLQEIKTRVDQLNLDLQNHKIVQRRTGLTLPKDSPEEAKQYEEYLQDQIDAFGRISKEMVNGNDIALADSIAKEIKDQKEYIYKNLIKGPYGCEADVEKITFNFPSTPGGATFQENDWGNFNINSVPRMTYPYPIIYDYNVLKAMSTIPDPWNSGYSRKMPNDNMYDKFAPGFLNFVHFGTVYSSDKGGNKFNGNERLHLDGLMYNYDTGGQGGEHVYDAVSLGKSKKAVEYVDPLKDLCKNSSSSDDVTKMGILDVCSFLKRISLEEKPIKSFEESIGIY